MLKMKCPNCHEMIVSALLSDMDQVPCGNCKEIVPVQDVMVFADGFTFHRSDLVKRLFRYKTLLDEITKERELLEKNPDASKESKKSLERFSHALIEVMSGARNNLRIEFTDQIPLSYRFNSHSCSGVLINLSMSGVCFEVVEKSACPQKKSAVVIGFSLPGIDYEFTLAGTVSWVKKGLSVGVEFDPLAKEDVDTLWHFISSAVED